MTKFTPAIYGAAPKDLGEFKVDTSEMMFWLYLPIKMPGMVTCKFPKQLMKFGSLVVEAAFDARHRWRDSYVYLSVKTLHVTPDAPGNRPGWHSDGFLTDDLNYIWCDRNPTEFFITEGGPVGLLHLPEDHAASMKDMEWHADRILNGERLEHGQVNHLYRLDQTVIHRVSPNVESGKRAFIKVSVSNKPYAQLGNSINHDLPGHPLPTLERKAERNCPQGNH